jgi:hypothetical protein
VLSVGERRAVCLDQQPDVSPGGTVPGGRGRFEPIAFFLLEPNRECRIHAQHHTHNVLRCHAKCDKICSPKTTTPAEQELDGCQPTKTEGVNVDTITIPTAVTQTDRLGVFRVASASRPGLSHTVLFNIEGGMHCDCEAGRAGHLSCRHRTAVEAHLIAVEEDLYERFGDCGDCRANLVQCRSCRLAEVAESEHDRADDGWD